MVFSYIIPICVAISIAGNCLLNRTYALFSPVLLLNVLTLSTFTLKMLSSACLMSLFVAFSLTTKINLFSDSISRMDFSVDSGCLMTTYGSITVHPSVQVFPLLLLLVFSWAVLPFARLVLQQVSFPAALQELLLFLFFRLVLCMHP